MAEGKKSDAPCCTGYALDGPEGCTCSAFCARLAEALKATGMDMVGISVTSNGEVSLTVTRPDPPGTIGMDVAINAEGTVEMAECSDDALVELVRSAKLERGTPVAPTRAGR